MKAAESGDPRGFDAGKLMKDHRRHTAVDTLGLMVDAVVHLASV
jgi:hypothetical protein